METIYSVEEVAEMLKLQPFTVRKMFRDRKLSGFKIGKAWRISESRLEADIMNLQEGTQFSNATDTTSGMTQPPPQPQSADISQYSIPPELFQIAPSAPPPKSLLKGSGRLMIFSDTPGEEVILDGDNKGPTTLSLLDIPEGEHTLQVGTVVDTITVAPDSELRIRATGEKLEVTTRSSAPILASSIKEMDAMLQVQVENTSDWSGELLVQLSGGNEVSTKRLFSSFVTGEGNEGDQKGSSSIPNEDFINGKVQLRETLTGHDRTDLFNESVAYVAGDNIEIIVPKQLGIEKSIHQTFPLSEDLCIKLSIASGGLLRGKHIVRINRENSNG